MKKILVKAPATSMSGYGEHARLILRALKDNHNVDLYLMNIGWGQTNNIPRDTEEKRWLEQLMAKTNDYFSKNRDKMQKGSPIFDVSVQVTIPNEWEKIAVQNIGVTAGIEVDRISHVWIQKAEIIDKIIVPSNFAKQGFDNTVYEVVNNKTGQSKELRCRKEVEVIHYPVKSLEKDIDFETNFFSQIKTEKNFLAIAQWSPRKDIELTIEGFIKEFHDEEIGLIVKTNLKNNSNMDREETKKRLEDLLSSYPDKKCSVYLLHGGLTEEQMNSLYTSDKVICLASTTHGEGYGLPLFEAAYNALPIIAPKWSGHVDFLTASYEGKVKYCAVSPKYQLQDVAGTSVWKGVIEEGSKWCYVDEKSYRESLRKMVSSHYSSYKKRASVLSQEIKKNFSSDKIYRLINESIAPDERLEDNEIIL